MIMEKTYIIANLHHIARRCTYHITCTCIAPLYHNVNTYFENLYIISLLYNIANTVYMFCTRPERS